VTKLSLMDAVDCDVKFRSFVEELQRDPPLGIRAMLEGTSEYLEHRFVYAIEHLDTKLWIQQVRDILLAGEAGSASEPGSLVSFTELASSVDAGEIADRWFDIVQQATVERRSIVDKLLRRGSSSPVILQSEQASARPDFLNQLADSFRSGIWESVPQGLLRLIGKRQSE